MNALEYQKSLPNKMVPTQDSILIKKRKERRQG